MTILFLVNGPEHSADGLRAIELAKHLPREWRVTIAYRQSKVASVLNFLRCAVAVKPDVLVVIKMAYSGVLAGILSKYALGCALVCDTGDAAYALAKSTGRYSRLQLGAIWAVEKIGSHSADWIITRGSYHKELLAAWGITSVTVIPDGVDTAVEQPRDGTRLIEELGLQERFVLGLVGSMEWSEAHQFCYGWDVIEALGLLSEYPVAALLVGDGSGRKPLEQRAAELGVGDKVRFVGMQPYERLGEFLGAMHICISTQSADLVGMVRTTGKLPLYLAHDKFVVATDVGEARRVLPGVGRLLPYQGVKDPSHPARLANAVREYLKNPDQVRPSGAARRVAIAEFDYVALGERLRDVLQKAKRA